MLGYMSEDVATMKQSALESLLDKSREYDVLMRAAGEAREELKSAVGMAYQSGVAELRMSRETGIPRMTIRRWLGKPTKKKKQ